MKKSLKISILVLLFLVLIFAGLAIYFIAKNTSFLTTYISNTNLDANNQNAAIAADKYTQLQQQEIFIPDKYKSGIFADTKYLSLPVDFKVSLWVAELNNPRQITWTAAGNLIVADRGSNSIKLLANNADNNYGEVIATIDSNLNSPSSVDYYNGDLYIGTQDQIIVYKNLAEDGTYSTKQVVIDNLPSVTADTAHKTRTVKVGPDKKLYITIGSSCNLCMETDERRATMMQSNLDGSDLKIYASGLRNTVDFVFKATATDFKIWGVDNGRDLIGDDLPPDEVNVISEGKNYGWPYCYGSGINNPEYPERSGFCKTETEGVTYGLQAHSAPLGLTFLVNDDLTQRVKFPQLSFKDDLFIAYHGSWNRSIPTGYKIVRLNTSETNAKEVNFITGWLTNNSVWGRPVDVKFDKKGDMFITDDLANAIYKVEYTGAE